MKGSLFRVAFLLGFVTVPETAHPAMKVYISADMEGVVGVVTGDQLGPAGFEYARFREFMTREVLAAIEGARSAGATEILVSDSHGNGQNLLIDMFPKEVQIVRSWPRPQGMMAGIDATFDAAIFIGYHSSTTNIEGVRAHTFSSANLTNVQLNGISVPESGFNAAIAGHYDVPVVMISGDDAIVEETKALLGDVEGAIVKWAYSFHSARTLTPEASYELIRATVTRGLGRLSDFKPYKISTPVRLDVSFKSYRPPQLLAYLPVVQRTDSHSIRFTGRDMLEVSHFVGFMTGYSASLTP
ncbi:MAG: M55 family metallopeptidase [Acidobacteriota bacterium]